MLKGKQKRYLRSQAHHLRPMFQIGKDGLSATWLEQVEYALEKHELIKVNILQNSLVEAAEVKEYLAENSDIEVVQTIGNVLVLYRRAHKVAHRKISNEVAAL